LSSSGATSRAISPRACGCSSGGTRNITAARISQANRQKSCWPVEQRSDQLAPSILIPQGYKGLEEIGIMADLQKLFFETRATVSDREILATARLNASVKAFAGQELSDDVMARINQAVADEVDRLIKEGVLFEKPDWLAVIFRRRLYVAFGSGAVQQLSRELKDMGAV
jgi:hypothetical protein